MIVSPKLQPLAARTAATAVATLALAAVFWVAFSLYWDHVENLKEENSRNSQGFGLTESKFYDLRLVFWILYFGMVILAPLATFAIGKMTRTPIAVIAGLILLDVLGLLFALPLLDFQNECNLGDSFLIETHC